VKLKRSVFDWVDCWINCKAKHNNRSFNS